MRMAGKSRKPLDDGRFDDRAQPHIVVDISAPDYIIPCDDTVYSTSR